MKCLMTVCLIALAAGCSDAAIDVGAIDQKSPPAAKELVVPKDDKGVSRVGLRATVTASLKKDKRQVYLLVNPLSNAATKSVWWVQEDVTRGESKASGECQFGEPSEGAGEYFAIVAVAIDKELKVGEQLKGIPTGDKATFSKLKIVKRKK